METYIVKVNDDGAEYWYNEAGQLHRTGDKPAYSYPGGCQEYWQNGKCHRVGKPAIVRSCGLNEYYQNDRRHREDGPAVIYSDGTGEYYLNGKFYSQEDWQKAISSMKSCNGKVVEVDGKQYRLEEV